MNRKYLKEWMEKAEQDYQTVILLLRQRKKILPDVICFHAHQCIEKYLKAMLVKHGVKIPKTHDLIFLVNQFIEKESDLELSKDILRELNRYAVELRYPGEKASKGEAKNAGQYVQEIRSLILTKLASL